MSDSRDDDRLTKIRLELPDHKIAEGEAPSMEPIPPIPGPPPLAEKIISATRDSPGIVNKLERKTEPHIDENQETDIWWGSYAGRTMIPGFVVCILLTTLIIWGVWLIWPEPDNRPHLERYTTYILAGAVWSFQLIRWGYRILAINYRLTTHRLFCQRGFQRAGMTAIDLAKIATVRIERAPLENQLKVGRLRIIPVDPSQPPLLLEGVWRPNQIAALIMKQVQQARHKHGKTVLSAN
ncbi:MAG TPA: hypothetical protein VGX70_13355 [Gemmataceae bacterium]|jgi:membrane protein YdbS with pleckstrin-like domain|nr:hypothetical protein [Gemmataceae bacterium]